MTVGGFEDGHVFVDFPGGAQALSDADGASLSIAFEDATGAVLSQLSESLTDEDGESRMVGNRYTTAYEGGVPENAVRMKVALVCGGEEISTHAVWFRAPEPTPTPEITPEPEATPEPEKPVLTLHLEGDSATARRGKVRIAGTVQAQGEVSGRWALYVNGEKCEGASFEASGDGSYTFEATDYPCAEVPSALQIRVQDAADDQIRSAEVSLQVEPPVIVVSAQGYEGIYDGQPHTATVSLSEDEDVRYLYAVSVPGEDADPKWQENLPEFTDAGEWILKVRAEKEGCAFEYERAGSKAECAQATIRIQPAPVEVRLWAEQTGDAVYNGKKQSVAFEYRAEVSEDDAGLFDLTKITNHDQWPKDGAVETPSADAGRYPVSFDAAQFGFAAQADANFEISTVWDAEKSYVTVQKAKVAFVSESVCGLYGTFKDALKGEYIVQIEGEYAKDDLYRSDVAAKGLLSEAGTAYNEITITEGAAFAKRQQNYEFDLTANRGVVVVFPQSIDSGDPLWESAKDTIDPKAYAGCARDALPGYYDGMQVALEKDEGEYDGQPHDVRLRFTDRNGAPVEMTEGVDYTVRALREGAQTQDFVSAGSLQVEVSGEGNYCGKVTLDYEIVRQSVEGSVRMDSWDYDGQAAGSDAHPVIAQPEADRYVFQNAAGEAIDPPSAAGEYAVRAVWEDTQNVRGGESEAVFFRIRPAKVTVIIGQKGDEIVMEIGDESGLFDAETMVEYDGEEYRCTNENFDATFDVSADVKAANAQSRATLSVQDWIYDGEAALSAQHEVRLTGADASAKILFYDLEGAEIDPPSEAGRYRVAAVWGNPSVRKEAEFEIQPRTVTVCAEDARKTFGEDDPELKAKVEGVLPGDEIAYACERAAGEDTGEYAILPIGEAEQGSYRVEYEGAVLTIEPKSIENASVELLEGRATVRMDGETALVEDRDYRIEIEDGAEDAETKQVTVVGAGNYTGQAQALCRDVSIEMTLRILDSEGRTASIGVLTTTREGLLTFGVQVESNVELDAERLSLFVNDEKVASSPERTAECAYRFAVEDYAVTAGRTNVLSAQVLLDGEVRAQQAIVWTRPRNKAPWIVATALMAAGAIASGVVCARLNRTLKKEKDKLLDEDSRQSNRTIRESE